MNKPENGIYHVRTGDGEWDVAEFDEDGWWTIGDDLVYPPEAYDEWVKIPEPNDKVRFKQIAAASATNLVTGQLIPVAYALDETGTIWTKEGHVGPWNRVKGPNTDGSTDEEEEP